MVEDYLKEFIQLPRANIIVIDHYIRELPIDLFLELTIATKEQSDFILKWGWVLGMIKDGKMYSVYICSPNIFRDEGVTEK